MGSQFCKFQSTMNVLLFVALAIATVVAEPEADADPAVLYGGYYGHPGYYGYGQLSIQNPYGYSYQYGHHLGKRSADAEAKAEADADAEAASYYVNSIGGFYGHGYGLGHRYGYYGYPYIHSGHYLGLGHHFGKRSADAEPEAKANAEADANAEAASYYVNSIGGFYGHGYDLGHRYGYYGYPYVRNGHYLGLGRYYG